MMVSADSKWTTTGYAVGAICFLFLICVMQISINTYTRNLEKSAIDLMIQEKLAVQRETILNEIAKNIIPLSLNEFGVKITRQRRDTGDVQKICKIVNANCDIRGPPGMEGRRGLDGMKGIKGEKGYGDYPHIQGPQGYPGRRGEKGEKGENIFPIVAPGPKGDIGLPGQKGNKGDQGMTGSPGKDGSAGKDGENGREGQPGPKGDEGQQGEQGLTGSPGHLGAMGPPGPPAHCPVCTEQVPRCDFTKITKYGQEDYSELPQRRCECQLRLTGDKVAYGCSKDLYSAWMVDSSPIDVNVEMFWVTNPTNHSVLIEYVDAASLTSDVPTKVYDLVIDFDGNAHVVYGGRFIYKAASKPRIVAFYLNNQTSRALAIPGITSKNLKPLYESSTNYFDFSIDENGLWVIFAVPESTNTGIMKIDANTLTTQYIWNISLDHSQFMEMFVASGILYAVERRRGDQITISLGLDLYKKELIDVQLNDFGSPEGIKMFTFNHRTTQLLMLVGNKSRISYQASCGEKESIPTSTTPIPTATDINIAEPVSIITYYDQY